MGYPRNHTTDLKAAKLGSVPLIKPSTWLFFTDVLTWNRTLASHFSRCKRMIEDRLSSSLEMIAIALQVQNPCFRVISCRIRFFSARKPKMPSLFLSTQRNFFLHIYCITLNHIKSCHITLSDLILNPVKHRKVHTGQSWYYKPVQLLKR